MLSDNLISNCERQYQFFDKIAQYIDSMYDYESKECFQARLNLDINLNLKNWFELVGCYHMFKNSDYIDEHYKKICNLIKQKKPIYIYGTGYLGKIWCKILKKESANIVGFFDRNYATVRNCLDLPVFPPPSENNGKYIINSVVIGELDVYNMLKSIGFSDEQIFPMPSKSIRSNQYFDFKEKCKFGDAFIDAGSLNCATSVQFANWCNGEYSKIFAFEPDPDNYKICKQVAKDNLENVEIINAGLYNQNTTLYFESTATGGSKIEPTGNTQITVVTLDSVVKDTKVSFIKMDIEGSELAALEGAVKIIKRDKPLCAISVYHKMGDVVVIMDYLKHLVPEYRFALRHYSNCVFETVLYAFCD